MNRDKEVLESFNWTQRCQLLFQ